MSLPSPELINCGVNIHLPSASHRLVFLAALDLLLFFWQQAETNIFNMTDVDLLETKAKDKVN